MACGTNTFTVHVSPPAPAARQSAVARRIEGFFVRYRRRLPWLHLSMAVVFLALIVGPALVPEDAARHALLGRLPALANWLVWGLWFPLVFLSVIFTGRSWCGVLCPMGAASEWANRIGLQRPLPRWLRWEGTPIVTFLVVTVLGQTVGVRDYPDAMLEVFGATLVAALAVGFLYGAGRRRRAWCRHACPIGLLLGVFSRLGAVDFVPKRPRDGGDRHTDKGPCPTFIDINRKRESRHCIQCFRCVHPRARGGLRLQLRRPGAELARIRDHHPKVSEVWFLFLGTGVSLGAFLWLVLPGYQSLRQAVGAWFIEHGWYWVGQSGPGWLMVVHPEAREVFVWLDFLMIVGFALAVMLAMTAVLCAATAVGAWLAGRFGADLDGRGRFVELGYQYAPVAMTSLLLGLGGELFDALTGLGAHETVIMGFKVATLAAGVAWSIALGARILRRQGLHGARMVPAMVPCVAGSLAVAAAWWPAVLV
jgi:polyferredoxin